MRPTSLAAELSHMTARADGANGLPDVLVYRGPTDPLLWIEVKSHANGKLHCCE